MKRRYVAIGLALLLGNYGFHWFYLGRWSRGALYCALSPLGLSIILGWIDAIYLLRMSKAEFSRRYRQAVAPLSAHRASAKKKSWLGTSSWSPSAAFDDSDVERLRQQWQVDVHDPGFRPRLEHFGSEYHDDLRSPVINPATGLTMIGGMGGFDTSGHVYGTGFADDTLNHWHHGDTFARHDDDAFRSFEDSSFKSRDH